MKPEVDAERPVGQLPHACDLSPQVLSRKSESGENSQSSRIRDFGGQLGTGDPAHSRLNDGIDDVQQIAKRRAHELRALASRARTVATDTHHSNSRDSQEGSTFHSILPGYGVSVCGSAGLGPRASSPPPPRRDPRAAPRSFPTRPPRTAPRRRWAVPTAKLERQTRHPVPQ